MKRIVFFITILLLIASQGLAQRKKEISHQEVPQEIIDVFHAESMSNVPDKWEERMLKTGRKQYTAYYRVANFDARLVINENGEKLRRIYTGQSNGAFNEACDEAALKQFPGYEIKTREMIFIFRQEKFIYRNILIKDNQQVAFFCDQNGSPLQDASKEMEDEDRTTPEIARDTKDPAQQDKLIQDILQEITTREKLPGMTAAITDNTGLIAQASVGLRKVAASEALTNQDLIHLGSCTKAMTSAMLAILVADGVLSWETTLSDAFPELKDRIHSNYLPVTLWQLVTHRAGILANAQNWGAYSNKPLIERRLLILEENLKDASGLKAGEFLYSNLGYMVAASLAERLTGKSWETLMQERLFNPLGMTSAGFGPPNTRNQADQPWGHIKNEGKWQPTQYDNPEALGPAGTVHCNLADWAKFLALQLPNPSISLLDAQQTKKLAEPSANYAGGWGVVERGWAKGITLSHSGSNTTWYVTVWVAPQLNRAFIVATNSCDDHSGKVCDEMIGKLVEVDQK
ncbi:MAG: serine hydrolase [Bacteroidia bacterium]|nr:serine hydrolase [Bacteroidia bacterium]